MFLIWGVLTSFAQRPPARNPAGKPCWEDVSAVRQADGVDRVGEEQWLVQLQQGDVIIVRHVIIFRVGDYLFDVAHLHVFLRVLGAQSAVCPPVVRNEISEHSGHLKIIRYNTIHKVGLVIEFYFQLPFPQQLFKQNNQDRMITVLHFVSQ